MPDKHSPVGLGLHAEMARQTGGAKSPHEVFGPIADDGPLAGRDDKVLSGREITRAPDQFDQRWQTW